MNILKIITLFLLGTLLTGQQTSDAIVDSTLYDFWIGDWDLKWITESGDTILGNNIVERILNNHVIKENFSIISGPNAGFEGKSYSVFNKRRKTWYQTWVDNSGAYLDFNGETQGNTRIFKREIVNPDGSPLYQRMMFYSIDNNSFTWDWQKSKDGETWILLWRIFYSRK